MGVGGIAGRVPDERTQLLGTRIETLKKKLLDLSKVNRLINFKHSDRSKNHIRIIDEIPELLFSKLDDAKKLRFNWIDEPEYEAAEEATAEFRSALTAARQSDQTYIEAKARLGIRPPKRLIQKIDRELRDRVRTSLGMSPRNPQLTVSQLAKELRINPDYNLQQPSENLERRHVDSKIQTLLYREDMESKLAGIRDGARTLLQDAGISALYAAFCFLEWYESPQSDSPLYAPLVFYPVEIDRTLQEGSYTYFIQGREDDIEINITLAELLKQDYGLALPEWLENDDLAAYLSRVAKVISQEKRWEIKRWITVGLFTFSRLVMYRDLESKNWPASETPDKNSILGDLLVGREQATGVVFADDYDIDSPKIAASVPILVTDADCSQHSAIVDVVQGKNLAIQGPPGTGKSQTITNIIAATLQQGKSVLFVSEKMAALEDRSKIGLPISGWDLLSWKYIPTRRKKPQCWMQ